MLTNGKENITKSRLLLSIPRSLLKRNIAIGREVLTKKSDQTGESEQTWRRSFNCQITPLSLRLSSKMGTALFKGYFRRPAFHTIGHDGKIGLRLIG